HFFWPKCRKFFCDMCVATRTTSAGQTKTCRACGVPVTPIKARVQRAGGGRGFFARIPGAFIYPFRGFGVVILICATLAFAALGFMSAGIIAIGTKIVFYGFLFMFMQNLIHSTASDENEPLSFPEFGDIFGAAFQL